MTYPTGLHLLRRTACQGLAKGCRCNGEALSEAKNNKNDWS
ncbi:hypothetical protein NIASO_14970 [Niabella soli DSM 19437]|uniref:Uncharacterized protein n=1 Tax=Niabella soli DSM 19437 TaxID=929713 RepID=W0F8Y7_9BACT|nr:hypothetical protein NIASO_14970 [Niabella soli DSM 19437]